ncbi:MAG: hypothetical protein K0S20_432 [Patescibacteria group bacterium]|jgi:vancomycin permeability regulator SanA|nr:hypothetical protein [Patescibacteria group bacterium]
MKKLIRKIVLLFVLLIVIAIGGYLWIRDTVEATALPYLYSDIDEVPLYPTAMILGAQVFPGKVPSRALAYRLSTGIELYQKGKVATLLMSGDGRSKYYDEVKTMQEYAEASGIPSGDIQLDGSGLRTYASCYRAKHEFNFEKVIVVTQEEHLLRAVYTCRRLGVEAYGVVAPEFSTPDPFSREYWETNLREKAALVLAWFETDVIHRSL